MALYFFLALLLTPSAFASPLGIEEAWSAVSNPLIMGRNFETRFFLLPTRGQVTTKKRFWSGDYWPLNKGNINFRWNASRNFTLASPTAAQVQSMTQQELAQLSPSEKFDIFNGRYDYPLKRAVQKISDPRAKDWEGICHGWAPAAINHNEPTPKTLENPDRVFIPFGSSDIKGILSFYYAVPYQVPDTHQVGRRCDDSRIANGEDCQNDLNAGAFHVILTNKIALDNEGFIADVARFKEVWNHPILSYQTTILNDSRGARNNSAPGTIRTVKVNTRIIYGDEAPNNWNALMGTSLQKLDSTEFTYILEIDGYGQIIGGEWTSTARPDFLWTKAKTNRFSGEYARLPELLND